MTDDADLTFTISSVKICELNAIYRSVVEHHQRIASLNAEPPNYSSDGSVTAAYAAGPGLPRITIDARRAADFSWPLPDLANEVYFPGEDLAQPDVRRELRRQLDEVAQVYGEVLSVLATPPFDLPDPGDEEFELMRHIMHAHALGRSWDADRKCS